MNFGGQKTFKFLNPWNGKEMAGFFKFSKYWMNDRLAISIIAKIKDDEDDWFQPYCNVTVNLPSAKMDSPNAVFIDTNNAPWLEDFLRKNGFGLPTGRFRSSGFCNYPEYLLNLQTMLNYKQTEFGRSDV